MEILVKGERGEVYTLGHTANGWTCDCPDHTRRSNGEAYVCKHIATVAVAARDMFLMSMTAVASRRATEILASV